jgi:uncharacterized protein YqjF (DUF2071 family)
MSTFLTAEWRKLIMAQYEVAPASLAPWLPPGVELDLYQNRCYVSLVGFLFDRVRVLGLPIPFHTRFEEVNLRFYVARTEPDGTRKRGVVFIREFVPRAAITLIANSLYEEPYATFPMRYTIASTPGMLTVNYSWRHQQTWHSLAVEVDPTPQPIELNSEEEFITEHYWGYTNAPAEPPPSTASSIRAGGSTPSATSPSLPTSPPSTVQPSHPSTRRSPPASSSLKAPPSPSPPVPVCPADSRPKRAKPVQNRRGNHIWYGISTSF